MTSRMPFSIHTYLRRDRHEHSGPQFDVFGKTKIYARMPQIKLSEPAITPHTSFESVLSMRRSLPLDSADVLQSPDETDLSNLFGFALRSREDGTRPYPSGGALYPIETYFVGSLKKNEAARVYHYDPETHMLADLWTVPKTADVRDVFSTSDHAAPSYIVLTALWGRNGVKYGDFGYYLGMLEAGHAAQNILLCAAALDLRVRPMGGFDDSIIANLLDINEDIEQVVYIIMIGKDQGQK